jgi:hypothetical protein
MYIQDIEKLIDSVEINPTTDKIKEVTSVISSGDIQYAYPYQMKLFAIKYAKFVEKYYFIIYNE